MTSEGVVVAARAYFAAVGRASMELPDGWFGGRRFETYHALTDANEDGATVVLELDGLQRITITGRKTVAGSEGRELWIVGFDRLHLQARSFTDAAPLGDHGYDGGTLHFEAPRSGR